MRVADPIRKAGQIARLTAATFPVLTLRIGHIAVAVRAQHLTDIPRYTDEIDEILPAFDIVRARSSLDWVARLPDLVAIGDRLTAGAVTALFWATGSGRAGLAPTVQAPATLLSGRTRQVLRGPGPGCSSANSGGQPACSRPTQRCTRSPASIWSP